MVQTKQSDYLDPDGIAALAQQTGDDLHGLVLELHRTGMVACNARCREMAMHLLDQLGAHLNEWEAGFCRSIVGWRDERVLRPWCRRTPCRPKRG